MGNTTSTSKMLVTTSAAGISQTRIWDMENPLPVGTPIQWVIEKAQAGNFRARQISGFKSKPQWIQITSTDAAAGKVIALPGTGLSVSIRPSQEQAPLFRNNVGAQLRLYTRKGAWVLTSVPVPSEGIRVRDEQGEAFSVKNADSGIEITALSADLSLLQNDSPNPIPQQRSLCLIREQLEHTQIQRGDTVWSLGYAELAEHLDQSPFQKHLDQESIWFRQYLRYAVAGFGVMFLASLLWPKPSTNPTELIPAQVARIVLSQPLKQAQSEASAGAQEKVALKQKIEKAAVVQAFRAKALQSSVQGLLKGGMTRLLAQSDFVTGKNASAETRRMFDSSNLASRALASDPGAINTKGVLVASLGGTGVVSGGQGVGYGHGSRQGVSGQGTSQVSIDLGNTSVEAGLTKDEVGEVIHRHMSEVRYCYEAAILRSPGVEGRLIVNFGIGGSGNVLNSEVKSSTLPDPRLDDCILRRLASWKFPQTKGGITVAVTYPFIFKTLGR